MNKLAILEGLLFIVGDDGLTIELKEGIVKQFNYNAGFSKSPCANSPRKASAICAISILAGFDLDRALRRKT